MSTQKYLNGVDLSKLDLDTKHYPVQGYTTLSTPKWAKITRVMICILLPALCLAIALGYNYSQVRHTDWGQLGLLDKINAVFGDFIMPAFWALIEAGMALAVALLAGWLIVSYATSAANKNAPELPTLSVSERTQGDPGAVADAAETFGKNAEVGAAGEARTAELITKLQAAVPGLWALHGLRFPGSARADIDHVLIYGNTVIVVDSKLYKSGDYELRDGYICNDERHTSWETHMPSALDQYRDPSGANSLGRSVKVYGIIVVHGHKSTATGTTGVNLALETPQEFCEHVLKLVRAEAGHREVAPEPNGHAKSRLAGSLLPILSPAEKQLRAERAAALPPEPDFTRRR